MWRHLLPLTLAEWRHHPWRHAAAWLAVTLGVALASSVQLINHSALGEFAQAVRAANGNPDVTLAARQREGFDDALFADLARDEQVAVASPVLELDSHARLGPDAPRLPLRIVGIDALRVAAVAPALMPQAPPGEGATALIAPDAVWLNAAARSRLQAEPGATLWLQSTSGWQPLRVAGTVAAGGAPLAVLDIATAQARFGRSARLTRIDLRLVTGVDHEAWLARQVLPAEVRVATVDDAVARASNLSLAYRVNLGVLALVALLVGGFLVYSVLALSVAQRTPQFALLGVLGLPARERRRLVLAESAVLGLAGSLSGLALGALLAWAALRLLGGDLGGGYFPGVSPALRWPLGWLAACLGLGVAAAVAGAWWPARAAERLAPALALKGLGSGQVAPAPVWPAVAALAAAGVLALLPPVGGLPLAAYAAVALLLGGGVALVPAVVQALLRRAGSPAGALPLLALRRAHHARHTASATVAGVVASLALSVALTVMVASFREAVSHWLDSVLPAELYARSSASSAAADQAALPAGLAEAAAALPGVARVQPSRLRPLSFDPRQAPVTLVARALPEPAAALPLLGPLRPAAAGELAVYVSEPAASLYGWSPGDTIELPLAGGVRARVRGVWRDYARQAGAIAIDLGDYQRLSGDAAHNDLALWLQPGAALPAVQAALQRLAGPEHPLEMASTTELRRLSLAIFDRSFAVTRYLQVVAIAVGLVGVAASLSAQVMARRKEFGLLAHLGLTRGQVIRLVTLETLAWLAAGCVVGLGLGLAIAAVLVHVVNPQSFHWTMPMSLPVPTLAALAAAVLAAGALTAGWSARRAASRQAVLAVKEDW